MPDTLRIIIGQALGIMAPILTCISYQFNTKRSLLLIQALATLFNGLGYLFLGATAGFALNLVCILRNVIYCCQKSGSKLAIPSSLLFALAMIGLGALSWQGPLSLLIMVGLSINTVVMSLGSPQLLRKSIPLTSTLILIYNILVFTLGGIINESIAIVSSIVGIIRFNKSTKSKKDLENGSQSLYHNS